MLIAAMLLASCSTPQENTATMQPTEEATEAPATPEATAERTPEPEPEPDLNDPLTMAGELLNDTRVINGEDVLSMTENEGGMFSHMISKGQVMMAPILYSQQKMKVHGLEGMNY